MTISTRGRYATRIMTLLATDAARPSLTKFEIAESEAISPAYVQQIMMSLKAAGLVRSRRGRTGGFALAREPETITVAEVLAAAEGDIMLAPCHGRAHCSRAAYCSSRPMWEKAAALLGEFFAGVTVADMVHHDDGDASAGSSQAHHLD